MLTLAALQVQVETSQAEAKIKSLTAQLARLQTMMGKTGTVGGASMQRVQNATGTATSSVLRLTSSFVGLYASIRSIQTAVGTFAQFEKQMDAVLALTSATDEQMAQLSSRARELGKTTVFSANEAAQGMEKLAAAGLSVNQIYDAMGGIMNFAAAGPISVAEAADTTVRTLAQFNLTAGESSRVADVLAKASDISRANIQSLGESMRFVGANAAVYNISLEETTAMLAVLTQSGLDASMAGTGLRTTIASLLEPSKEATKMLHDYGISVEDLNVKARGLTAVLETLKTLPTTEFGKLFDTRGLTAALIATRDLDTFKQFNEQLKQATGHAEKMAAIRMDNLLGDWQQFKNLLTEIAITMGEEGISGALRTTLQAVNEGLRWLMDNFSILQLTVVRTWNDIANAVDTGANVLFTMILSASEIVEKSFLGVKSVVTTVLAFIEAAINKVLSNFTSLAASTLNTMMRAINLMPDLSEKIIGKDGIASIREARNLMLDITKELGKNPLQVASEQMAKGAAEIDAATKRYDETLDGLAQGLVARRMARSEAERMLGMDVGLTALPNGGMGGGGQIGGGAGANPQGEQERIVAMFDRFHTAAMSVDALNNRIAALKHQLNDEDWIEQATEEDFQEAMDEMGAMHDALRRRFEANSVGWNQAMRQGFKETVDSYGTLSQRMANVGAGLAESLDTNLTNGFTNIITGTESVQEAFANMSNAIIQDLIRIMVQQLIVRQILQGFGALFGGGAATGAGGGFSSAGAQIAPIQHDGGMVGEASSMRFVSDMAFRGAKRYHGGGFAGDEVPIIAQRGEGVFTKEQMAALGGGQRKQEINIVNAFSDADIVDAVARNPGVVLNIIQRNKKTLRAELSGQ